MRQSDLRKNQGQLSIPRYKKSIVSDRARAQGKIIGSKKERKKYSKERKMKERKKERKQARKNERKKVRKEKKKRE